MKFLVMLLDTNEWCEEIKSKFASHKYVSETATHICQNTEMPLIRVLTAFEP